MKIIKNCLCCLARNLPPAVLLAVFLLVSGTAEAGEPGIEFGFQHRARYVDFDNIIDYTDALKDENRFFRFRSRLWGRLLHENLEVKLQLANEFRHYLHPDVDDSLDEVYVDECYVKLDSLFGSDWYVIAGRQPLIRGEGFILFDSSPLDGSRSIYFNALVFGLKHNTVDIAFMGISNPAKDQYFPRINDKSKPLVEQDERAAGVYITSTRASGMVLEGVYLYKEEISPYDEHSNSFTPKRSLHITGGRTSIPAGDLGTIACEIAGGFGEEDPDRTISTWAGYASWQRRFETNMNPQLKLAAGGFSGDDPGTDRDEGWMPPFSRWPKWSELYIYSFIRERGVAAWSNLWFAGADCIFNPVKQAKVRLSYSRMYAFHAPAASSDVFGTGTDRGNLFQILTEFKLPKGFTGHVLYEYFLPGDYYADDDPGHFLRFELTWQFAHFFPF